MTSEAQGPITELLVRSKSGDPDALNRLMPLVYGELHRLAQSFLRRERAGHTLQSTALVNEAYLRLVGAESGPWQNRAHFLGVAANLMRQILVDHARARNSAKRGGNPQRLTLDDALELRPDGGLDVVALDDALNGLAALDPQQARIVELRFFAGLTIEECAEVLGVSAPSVKRHWASARAWLYREISQREPQASDP
jgi:RNA polymerase sigma factor (TIGR02999 family)